LQPGDVLITRHDDALSNWFLPGFWPHAALCLGTEAQRRALGITGRVANLRGMHFLEARKDGVQVRPLTDTLAVDAFLVLRPVILSREERATVLENALRHEGKLYDFEFDFTRSDRLVCTEVIYRSLNGVGPVTFSLERKAGRFTLPAESLLQQALLPENGFELIMLYGLQGNQILYGHPAVQLLQRSLSNLRNP
jgi:hypothetical protein